MRLRSLDGWRGLGAIAVALGHLELGGFAYYGGYLSHAYVLVDFFFVLSGFVIALIYVRSIRDGASARSFAIKRIGRLWPLHAFVLSLFIGVELAKAAAIALFGFEPNYAPFTSSRPDDMIVPTFLMLHAFGLDDGLTWNFPSWSVAAEFWTYLLFAAVLLATMARPGARLVVTALLVVTAGSVVTLWSENRMDATYDLGFLRCAYGFFTGMLLEAVWRSGKLSWLKGSLAEVVAAVVAIAFVMKTPGTPLEYLAPPVFAVATLIFAADGGVISRLLSLNLFEVLGRWSYSIYMVHAFVITCVMPRVVTAIVDISGGDPVVATLAITAIYLPAVVGLSAFTYRFVEVPGQRLFGAVADHLAGKGRSRPTQPAAAAAAAG